MHSNGVVFKQYEIQPRNSANLTDEISKLKIEELRMFNLP